MCVETERAKGIIAPSREAFLTSLPTEPKTASCLKGRKDKRELDGKEKASHPEPPGGRSDRSPWPGCHR